MATKPEPILFLSDARGIYIPRDFAQEVGRSCVTGVSDDDYADLENPESDTYWDTWDTVLNRARVKAPNTDTCYTLHQDGDLWFIPVGMEWSDDEGFFIWPREDDEE